jgi:AraC family transcriptional regulator, positive regulator of tynA and feaB
MCPPDGADLEQGRTAVAQDLMHWSTEAVAPDDQVAFWRDVVWQAFVPVTPTPLAPAERFKGSVTASSIGALGAARIAADSQVVSRTAEQVRRDPGEVFFLNLPLTAGTYAAQDGRTARLAPGDFTIVDSAAPFELGFEAPFEQLSFTIPSAALTRLLADPRAATARRVRGDVGLGAIASVALRAAAQHGAGDHGTALALGDHLAGLVALALGGLEPAAVPTRRAGVVLQLARDEVERTLGDPGLTPATVAARVGISTRYLHRLFSDAGPSFGRYVLERRLERSDRALADPAHAHWTVTQIAFEHGFNDPSYFARAYRSRYGRTPRDARGV